MRIKLMLGGLFVIIIVCIIFIIMKITPSSTDVSIDGSPVIKKTGSTVVVPKETTHKTVKLVPTNQSTEEKK